MRTFETSLYQSFNELINRHISFALFRLPWTEEPTFILEGEKGIETFNRLQDLNGKSGLLIAPFKPTEAHPILLIPAHKRVNGWKQIQESINERILLTHENANDDSITQNYTSKVDLEKLKQNYTKAYQMFTAELKQKHFSKLVLSRKEDICLSVNSHSFLDIFRNACKSYPRMMISLLYTPVSGIWIGSSPEILLSGEDNTWNTVALAGTMPLNSDETLPEEWSEKNKEEQAYVSRYIRLVLQKYSKHIAENGPYTVRAGNLVHLKTDFSFRLSDENHIGDLLDELHPTPAICGLPKQEAYQFIQQHEGYDREYYSGIIGYLNPQGQTSLYVNLRCMRFHNQAATLFAGGGLLESSQLESEWNETIHKMKTMKQCLFNNLS